MLLQLRLLHLAFDRPPVPHRNVQCGGCCVTKVAKAVGINREMVGVDAVEIIEHQRRKMASSRHRDFVVGDIKRGESSRQFRIVPLRQLLHVA